ncbi:MAG: DUF4968 domain-containing protein [Akkermansiaceae bacterium]|nr:DUF4968 domain-containing protein [Akkermansiaceae bacterium]
MPTRLNTSVRSFEWITPDTLEIEMPDTRLRLCFLEPGVVRCRYVTQAVFENIPSYGVAAEYTPAPPELEEEDTPGYLAVRTGRLEVRIRRIDGGLEFYQSASDRLLCADAEGMGHRRSERTGDDLVWVLKHMPAQAHFFGLGDKPCALNLRGRRLDMWGADHYKFTTESDPLYKSIPFFLCLNQGTQYGIFFDNTMRSYFDFGKEREDRLLFGADGGHMDYYFIAGEDALDTVATYTRLTGLPPMPPLWALGYHQSKWSYYPEEAVNKLARDFRKRKIPCDAIHLDIHHMEDYQSLTWSREYFPDPEGMVRRLGEDGFKIVTIADPGIKVNPDNFVWRSGFERNVFCRRHDGALLEGDVWPGLCTFPDFTSPDTRNWWAGLFRKQVAEIGIRGIWVDMNEPAIFPDRTFPDDTRHAFDGYSCSHLKAHNVYGQCMARATRKGMLIHAPNRRPFILSRAGFAGMQRYAATWTGDNSSDWENLKMANLMVQRLSTSGVSFCGADTGGFLGHPTPELFCRWMQMAAFHIFFRNHSNGEYGGQEPWCFGPLVEQYVRLAIMERYRLLPYLYTQFHRYHAQGLPIIRSLAIMYPENPDMYWRSSEFFLGDSLYIVPVHHPGENGRFLYMPSGHWYSLWTDAPAPASGEEVWVSTPMSHIPVFVRGGHLIPRWPVQQYVGQIKAPHVTYDLWWAPECKATSYHYEDAGDGQGHRVGMFRFHRFRYTASRRSISIVREGEGNLDPMNETATLALHALPIGAQPCVVADGAPCPGSFDERHVYHAEIPIYSNHVQIEL